MATLVSCVVDTDSGSGYDYSSLNAAEAANFGATGADLVSNDEYVECECRCSAGSADTTVVTFDGLTTDSTHYVKVYTEEAYRHDGKWNTSAYRLDVNGGGSVYGLYVCDSWYWFDGIQVDMYGSDTYDRCYKAYSTMNQKISNCFFVNSLNAYKASGVAYLGAVNGANWIWNNIFITKNTYNHSANCGLELDGGTASSSHQYVYNNTFIGGAYGFLCNSTAVTFHLKNNLSQDATVSGGPRFELDSSALTDSSSNNISDDATYVVASDTVNHSVAFADPSSNDYHLDSASETTAIGGGTDLSSDADISFSTDIDGDDRDTADWDVGADEALPVSWDAVATNFTAGTPTLGAPTVAQTFHLSATDIAAGVPVLDKPTGTLDVLAGTARLITGRSKLAFTISGKV